MVFVYGTLMQGFAGHHHMSGGRFEGDAAADGRLISLGEYPAFVEGSGTVHGELYTFDDLPAALDVLDEVEEFDPADPDSSEYVRDARTVRRGDGTQLLAWLYVYNRPHEGALFIESGDWRAPSEP